MKVSIIGSGFSSISAACYLAKAGYDITVYEKNSHIGGRARQYVKDGFKFDMGPTWYWMPDVFERFFADFGKHSSDYYQLTKMAPAYRVYFDKEDYVDIQDSLEQIVQTFESIEPGAGQKLQKFMFRAKRNYDIAIKDLVYRPGLSPMELVTKDTVLELRQFVMTIRDYVKKNFKNPRLQQILEFPVLFLGAKPSNTPLFYSFMNYADFELGTWFPKGGMMSVVDGFVDLAKELGVKFVTDATVNSIDVASNKSLDGLTVNGEHVSSDILVSGADYKHSESLLPKPYRMYSESYWDKKVLAPSSLLFYVGFSEPLQNVLHHTLFFDVPFDDHAVAIYDKPAWPEAPLFYASFPSKSDPDLAPAGQETAIFLIPLAPDLEDTEVQREKYFDLIMNRLARLTNQSVKDKVIFKTSYCVQDFKDDYNSYRGNAYGLANTLMQTAFLRPKLKSKKVKNLFFTGQLTVPGPGVPPSIISGKLVADLVINENKISHEVSI